MWCNLTVAYSKNRDLLPQTPYCPLGRSRTPGVCTVQTMQGQGCPGSGAFVAGCLLTSLGCQLLNMGVAGWVWFLTRAATTTDLWTPGMSQLLTMSPILFTCFFYAVSLFDEHFKAAERTFQMCLSMEISLCASPGSPISRLYSSPCMCCWVDQFGTMQVILGGWDLQNSFPPQDYPSVKYTQQQSSRLSLCHWLLETILSGTC